MAGKVGKGTVYLMAAALAGVLGSYAINVGLARMLGPALYGIFGVLMSLYQINRAFLQSGIPKATSKYLAESSQEGILRTSLWLQLGIAVLLASVYIIFPQAISSVLKDISLTPYLVVLGIIIIPYSLLFLYLDGYLNGLRMFKQQAVGTIILSVLRPLCTFLFVFMGMEIMGALLGYGVSIVLTLLLAVALFKVENFFSGKPYPAGKIASFAFPIVGSSLFLLVMRNIDTLFLKSLLSDNIIVGYYTAAVTLSNVPYISFSALGLTLLPAVSKSFTEGNLALTRKYITQSMRYLLLGLLPMTVLIASTAPELVSLLYSSSYSEAALPLLVLSFSTFFLLVFMTLSMILVGSGKPWAYAILSFLGAVIVSIGCIIMIPRYGILGAALSSLFAAMAASSISILYVFIRFRALLPAISFLRISLASAVIFAIGWFWNVSGMLLLGQYFLLGILYLLLLYLWNELTREDWLFVRNLM